MGRASDDVRDLMERERARRECRKHLADLEREHHRPPADVVPVLRDGRGRQPSPAEMTSGATSPFAMI